MNSHDKVLPFYRPLSAGRYLCSNLAAITLCNNWRRTGLVTEWLGQAYQVCCGTVVVTNKLLNCSLVTSLSHIHPESVLQLDEFVIVVLVCDETGTVVHHCHAILLSSLPPGCLRGCLWNDQGLFRRANHSGGVGSSDSRTVQFPYSFKQDRHTSRMNCNQVAHAWILKAGAPGKSMVLLTRGAAQVVKKAGWKLRGFFTVFGGCGFGNF